jgi:hypothetical protein
MEEAAFQTDVIHELEDFAHDILINLSEAGRGDCSVPAPVIARFEGLERGPIQGNCKATIKDL